jgi:hypothetical protein
VARLSPGADTVLWFDELGSGLIRARRVGTAFSSSADSVTLVVVSSFGSGLWDHGTAFIRAQWPGGIRLERVPLTPPPRIAVEIDAGPDDAVRAGLELLGRRAPHGSILIRRGAATAEDSTRVAREGGVLLHWPMGTWNDTAFAVYSSRDIGLVGPIPKVEAVGPGRPIVLDESGAPVAVEGPLGAGCRRTVGFSIDDGDLAIRSAGLRLIERLIAPCGGGWTPDSYVAMDSARLGLLEGEGASAVPSHLMGTAARPPATLPLVLAALCLLAERIVRRRVAQ